MEAPKFTENDFYSSERINTWDGVRQRLMEIVAEYLDKKHSTSHQVIAPGMFQDAETKEKYNVVMTLELVKAIDPKDAN